MAMLIPTVEKLSSGHYIATVVTENDVVLWTSPVARNRKATATKDAQIAVMQTCRDIRRHRSMNLDWVDSAGSDRVES